MNTNASIRPPAGLTTFSTANNPVEEFCAIGSPLSIEWKGKRYHTLMRGAKAEFITTNIMGGKSRITILPDTSFFIVDMPKEYATAGFEYNSPLTVRFLFDGSVYAFKTMLMRVHNHPPILVLEYPSEVQRYNMRSNERVSIVSPARISENGGSAVKSGAVLDISDTGARIGLEAINGFSVGATLRLSFTLSNGAAVNQLAAAVRSVSEEGGKYLLGIGFLGHDAAVGGYCRECADFAVGAASAGSAAMLGVEKEAVIEFARKNGKVMMRGWKAGENGYLLTEKPQGQLPPLSPGQGAVIRVENRGTIYGMAVTYKEFLKKTDLCYFPFQDDVIAHSLRGEERIQCQLLAAVHHAKNQAATPGTGVIVNLGKGGLRFVTGDSLQAGPGDELSMSFHLGGIGFIDRLKMRLMRVNRLGGKSEYAVQFIDMDAEHAKLLDAYFAFYRAWAA
ncbi:MAG: PilZ domain-containing protein [Nitrospinae bacterium]|nr:PilZ domain-containing protein [Nitrospinota bacterium]